MEKPEGKKSRVHPVKRLNSPSRDAKLAGVAVELGVRLRAADMDASMQERAFRLARSLADATPNHQPATPATIASALKKEFDSCYGPAWHCVVGKSFGSFVTHSTGGFLYFSLDKLSFLLFKTQIHNCRIVPEQKLYPVRFKILTYLGRPWKEYSRTIIMESVMADFIQPSGWMPWDGEFALKTLVYGEYANTGPGARTTGRVKWPGYKVMKNRAEAMQYTVGPFIQGNQWLSATGAPFFLGLRH